jgi:Zn-dependent protease with chaperone function
MSHRTRFEDISSRAWEHPADAAALAALQRLPGFDTVLRRTVGRAQEAYMRYRMDDLQRVGPDQYQPIHVLYEEVLHILDAASAPPLYIQPMHAINAMTVGMDRPFIVLSDKALAHLPDDGLQSILAHELGHVLSDHLVYKLMLRLTLGIGWTALGLPFTLPWVAAFAAALTEWDRKSELSADRASLLVLQDPDPVIQTLESVSQDHMDIMGGLSPGTWQHRLATATRAVAATFSRHPKVEVRVRELRKWADTDHYRDLFLGYYPTRSAVGPDPGFDPLWANARTMQQGLRDVAAPVARWWDGLVR